MKLIDEIIDILSSEEVNLENALIKTKILLHKMGEKSLLTWVNSELNGYSNLEDIPKYRIVSTAIYGTATNGYATTWTNHRLPISHLTKKEQEYLTILKFKESISSLESLAKSKNLSSDIPTEFCPKFNKGLAKGIYVESAYRGISNTQILEILTKIRSRLLDFILELSDNFSNLEENVDLKEESKKMNTKELFNHTIFGDNTTIIVGNDNSNNSHQVKNNMDELFRVLKECEINDKELVELEDAIEKDTSNSLKEYGKNVKDWVKKISGKAIEKNTIAEITEALSNYF